MVFLTIVQFAKKAKSKHIMVQMASTVTGHKMNFIRERLAEKLEFMRWDPYIRERALYKEVKRVRSMKH